MAPDVFIRKKSGDIRLCVDYRELNKKTQKDICDCLRKPSLIFSITRKTGAILEKGGRVIAYASRALNQAE